MADVRETGRTLFGDNCAVCHGRDAKGGRAFPTSRARPGCGAASPRRSPRPSASASIRPMPTAACRRCWPSAATACSTRARDRRTSSPMSAQPVRRRSASPATHRGRQGASSPRNCAACHGDDGKGKHRRRRARPDRPALDLWRRRSDRSTRRLGRPAGPHADLGRPAVAGRSQDPRALCRRSREAAGHERAARPPRQAAQLVVWLASLAALLLSSSPPMRISSMWR